MDISKTKSLTMPEIALIGVTRGAIGFGAGLLLAGKFKREKPETLRLESFFVRGRQHNSNRAASLRETKDCSRSEH